MSQTSRGSNNALEAVALIIALLLLVAAFTSYVLFSPLPAVKLAFPFILPTALLLLAPSLLLLCIYCKPRSRLFVFLSGLLIIVTSSLTLFVFDYSSNDIGGFWSKSFPGNIAFDNLRLSIEFSKQIVSIGLAALGANIAASALLTRKPVV
jgi:hypothetical protein